MSRIEQAERQMPVLMDLRKEAAKEKPFRGKVVALCLHITKETAVLALAYKEAGAEVYLTASNPDSTQDDVAAELRAKGIKVFGKRGDTLTTYKANLRKVLVKRPHTIVDDGADLIVTALEDENYTKRLVFAQEETTTGVIRLAALEKAGKLPCPVIAVNDAETKHLFDNVYGTGQSAIDGVIRATGELIAGKTVVVAGYGHCGRGIAARAHGMGANVIVTEVNPVRAIQGQMDGYRTMPMVEAAKEGDIFITVTGCKDVITKKHMKHMKPGAILANAGHFDVEVNIQDIIKFPELRLLGNGRLVNLVCAEGHPASVMDMSFATQFIAPACLVDYQPLQKKVYKVSEAIVMSIAKHKLKTMGLKIDTLTKQQASYLADYTLGT